MSKTLLSAAFLSGTFLLVATLTFAQVPIVQSQPDHVSSADDATPLNRQAAGRAPVDPELIENLMFQLQDLQILVAEQRGIIEELTYQVQILQQEQKERYVDIDRRIQSLQEQVSSGALVSQSSNPEADETTLQQLSDEEILAEYNTATALMQERKFDEAISRLAVFAQKYPDHPLAPNAWFWIGEIYLVQRQAEQAQAAYQRVVRDYAAHDKVPDSLYKLGVIAQQNAQPEEAARLFEQVINDYPDTQSAKLAEARLTSN